MVTPTVANQIHNNQRWMEMRARQRSEAAKKAWRTRRKQKKLSPTMLSVLRKMFRDDRVRLSVHWDDDLGFVGVSLTGAFVGFGRHRVTKSTWQALRNRSLLMLGKTRECGSKTSWDENGKPHVSQSFDKDYMLSGKGRALARSLKL